jgi:polar amino acid transport system substrate-binding protein
MLHYTLPGGLDDFVTSVVLSCSDGVRSAPITGMLRCATILARGGPPIRNGPAEPLFAWKEVNPMLPRTLVALLLLLPGVAFADEIRLVEPGKLTWGSSPTFTPFEFMVDGKPAGFDVDLVDALSKRLDLSSNMMGMEFKGVIPALLGNRVDIGVSGLYVTAERLQVADFIPYILVGNQIVVQRGNPKNLSGRDSLCGFKVAVPVSTAFEASAKQASADCKARGKPEIELLSLPGSNNVALALEQGRVDAALNSTATIAAMMSESPNAYELAGEPFDADTKVGIALRKDSGALKARLEQAMLSIVKDGTYAALMKKWNLPAKASVF